jgi:hypothetical protein
VAPSIFRPVLTASRPSQTIPTTGPESTESQLVLCQCDGWLTVGNESLEETLAGKVGVVLLEVLLQDLVLIRLELEPTTDLGRRHLLEGNELESSLLESGDNLTDESRSQNESSSIKVKAYPRWTPSGLDCQLGILS